MNFLTTLREWFDKYIGSADALYLLCIVFAGILVFVFLGIYLSPIIAALIFAFALNPIVEFLQRLKIPRLIAIFVVVLLFVGLAIALILGILPLVSQQTQQMFANVPQYIDTARTFAQGVSSEYPDLVSPAYIDVLMESLQERLTVVGGTVIQGVFTRIPDLIALVIFLVLVPICLFFLLKDHEAILNWVKSFTPDDHPVLQRVGSEMTEQISRYIRGKVVEILVVGLTTYVVFGFLGLDYAALLALLVGLSVIVPFVGAVLVTIPVVLVATLQFGWSLDLLYVLIAYLVIQILDGNVLVPLLFSKAVNLHPLAIIAAVLVFGGLWGIWGVFFAIPLAILIKVLVASWPKGESEAATAVSD